MTLPKHIAIIMDGNGRWAQSHGRPRNFGHIKGARVARTVIEECTRLGIKNLTLYTFSTENWFRPLEEVSFLMSLLERHLIRERKKLVKNNIRFRCIGDQSRLPSGVRRELEETIRATQNNNGMNLTFALSYGGRQEILASVQTIAAQVKAGVIDPNEITEEMIESHLQTSYLPDPDLIIRTSGEFRISNFLLWQSAYSEFYITAIPWPEFTLQDFKKAIDSFGRRERRFGRISAVSVETQPQETTLRT